MATLSYDDELQLRRLLSDFGPSVGEAGVIYQQDYYFGDGSTQSFVLTQTPVFYLVLVYLNGVLQQDPEDFSISGTTVTFVVIPASGVAITFIYSYA